jgi:hypothetical protein
MTKAALVARLKKEYAAEDYFTGVLGSRASAFKPRPKPLRSKATLTKKPVGKASPRSARAKTAKIK